mgnify:FL=1
MASRINWAPLIAQQASRNQRRQESMYGMGRKFSKWNQDRLNRKNANATDDSAGGGVPGELEVPAEEKEKFNLLSTLFPNKGEKYKDDKGLFQGGNENRFLGRARDLGNTAYDLAAKGGPQYIKQGLQNMASLPAQFKSGLEGIPDSQTEEEYWQSQESMEPQRKKGLFDFLKGNKGGSDFASGYDKDKEIELTRKEAGFNFPYRPDNKGITKYNMAGNQDTHQDMLGSSNLYDSSQGESYDTNAYDFNSNISGDTENMSNLDFQAQQSPLGSVGAVKQFQKDFGLTEDGIFGPKTRASYENQQQYMGNKPQYDAMYQQGLQDNPWLSEDSADFWGNKSNFIQNKPSLLSQNQEGYEMLLDDGTQQFYNWGDPAGPIKTNPYGN